MSFAILAPNPHNRQPWLVELVGSDELNLYCDLDRRLPSTDPFDRQIVIGLGGFLELFSMAAAADGWATETRLFPRGAPGARLDGKPIANLSFKRAKKAAPSALFGEVLKRRSSKRPYDMARPVQNDRLEALQSMTQARSVLQFETRQDEVDRIRKHVWDAFVTEARTHDPHMETVNLMRLGAAEIAENPDGISLEGPQIDPLARNADAARAAFADTGSEAFGQMLAYSRVPVEATPAFVWLTTPGNSRHDQIQAGRDWLRLNLAATKLGLGVHPQSATLQEYPEMDLKLRAVHRLLGVDDGRIQMVGRLGYAAASPPTPRWPVETRLKTVPS